MCRVLQAAGRTFRTYPVTAWAAVGVSAFLFKPFLIKAAYQDRYQENIQSRIAEEKKALNL